MKTANSSHKNTPEYKPEHRIADAQNDVSQTSAHREYSRIVLDGPDRAASRAMLYAVGFTPEDFKKSQVGIASTWNMVTLAFAPFPKFD